MSQLNVQIPDELKDKIDWMSEVNSTSIANLVRQALEDKFDKEKARHQDNRDFVRWIRTNR